MQLFCAFKIISWFWKFVNFIDTSGVDQFLFILLRFVILLVLLNLCIIIIIIPGHFQSYSFQTMPWSHFLFLLWLQHILVFLTVSSMTLDHFIIYIFKPSEDFLLVYNSVVFCIYCKSHRYHLTNLQLWKLQITKELCGCLAASEMTFSDICLLINSPKVTSPCMWARSREFLLIE